MLTTRNSVDCRYTRAEQEAIFRYAREHDVETGGRYDARAAGMLFWSHHWLHPTTLDVGSADDGHATQRLRLVAPSLIQMGYGEAEDQAPRVLDLEKPLGTVTAGGNKFALSSAFLVGAGGPAYSGKLVPVQQPFGTLLTENHKQLVTTFLAQYSAERRGFNPGRSAEMALSTILTRGTQVQLVTSHIMKMYGTTTGSPAEEPLHTVPAGGLKHAEVRAFLPKYYGTDQEPRLDAPLHSITTKDRFGLVTIHGERYAIVDIGMRMLTPAELYRAQGFREGYIIDRGTAGKPITRTA